MRMAPWHIGSTYSEFYKRELVPVMRRFGVKRVFVMGTLSIYGGEDGGELGSFIISYHGLAILQTRLERNPCNCGLFSRMKWRIWIGRFSDLGCWLVVSPFLLPPPHTGQFLFCILGVYLPLPTQRQRSCINL
ncbi:hypothetical protein L873DRAFT_305183 [Choiromyces venosus 120613-1]|uniref:Uncharacterized protein n=1 Tax=Choiromyces venosus 120613-1 TaxID=1336337 RepID=A0A3N4IZR5_9PEZI|nr:hypothetical protein L873DRAFT_305183 [Choiromyces venosus 120613-1]